MFMVVVHVDASSKWPVVILMKDSDAMRTVEALREMLGQWGMTWQVATDNGPQDLCQLCFRGS